MSLNFINDFQRKIHYVLSNNENVRTKVQNVYLSIVQDGKCPFLLINLQKATNLSRYDELIYEVNFEICIFSNNYNKDSVIAISDEVLNCLTPKACSFYPYSVAGLKLIDISFQKAVDLLSNKLTMNYKTMIKRL